MSIFHNNGLIGASGQGGGAGGYSISRSLRFNSSDSAYLSRTPASAGNRTTWTWAGWVKKTVNNTSEDQCLFGGYSAQNDTDWLEFGFGGSNDHSPADKIYWTTNNTTSGTTAVYRDNSAWYHIVATYDGSNLKFYVNNELVLTSAKTGNLGVNVAGDHAIGKSPRSGVNRYFSGYLADIYFIDGQALTPSSFTETDATTGQLIPKAYTGSYGTNGFHLEFADNSAATATTLGKDTSGNGNNWTPNNLSVTAGAGNDSLVDTPTSYGTDTGVGGSVRGNYGTWNPLIRTTATYTNGNLDVSLANSTSGANPAVGTIFASSGKWYWEVACVSADFGVAAYRVGITTPAAQSTGLGNSALSWCFLGDGKVFNGGTPTTYGTSITNGDILNIALDVDAGRIWYGRNGTWFASGNPATNTSPSQTFTAGLTLAPAVASGANTTAYVLNAGARPFAYTAPSGFKALCDTNLPAPVVAKPNTVMDVKLYTGNGSTQTISGLNFSPDLVWIKVRSTSAQHVWTDVVRGTDKQLFSSLTNAEQTSSTGLTAFTSDGFSLGSNPQPSGDMNTSAATYVAWTWDAGSSTVTNTQGSITSSVRANPSAGFSVVTYTGNGSSGATIGHGLGVKPALIITKNRDASDNWVVQHTSQGAGKAGYLNTTDAFFTSSFWNSTEPTSSVFSVGNQSNVNGSGVKLVAYCFAPVAGYSNAFSYTGNGSSDGPMVYLGFRPRFIIQKRTDAAGSWLLIDTARDPVNVARNELFANLSAAEFDNTSLLDVLSNGFKIRATFANMNASGGSFIGFAFAEAPFNYSRAR